MNNPDYVFERRMRRYELTEDVNDCRIISQSSDLPPGPVVEEGFEDDVNFEVR